MPLPPGSPPSTSRRRTLPPRSSTCFEGAQMTETKMNEPEPKPRLTAVTLGVRDFHSSLRFYEALGFARKLRSAGDEIAFFDAGGVVLALYRWDELAQDAALEPRSVGTG